MIFAPIERTRRDQMKIDQSTQFFMFRRVIDNFVIPYGTYNTLFCLTTAMFTLVTGLSILAGVSPKRFHET